MVSVPNPTVGSPNTVVVKNKDDNGFLVDKPIKIAEAWYFKEASEAGDAANGTKYSIENPTEVAAGAKPIYKEDPAGNYVKIDLTLSNISSRGALGTYSEKKNNFEADGYNTVYIRGMENEIIHEGEDLDIYVKYVLDKEALEVGITNENYEETKSSTSSASSNTEEKENGSTTTGEERMALEGDKRSILALESRAYIIAQYIAKFIVTLNGVDIITFAGGIGENGFEERERICNYLGCFGIKLDKELNKIRGEEAEISAKDSKVKILIVPTNEEIVIATDAYELTKNLAK